MQNKQKIPTIVRWLAAFLLLFCIVMLIRYFLIGSYRVSTHSMEDAVHKDDFILVNKLSGKKQLQRNQVLLFSSPLLKDKEDAPLLVSRVIALPGDTIRVDHGGYNINGKLIPRSPHTLIPYSISKEIKEPFVSLLKKLNIPERFWSEDKDIITFRFTPLEVYQIREEMTERVNRFFVPAKAASYSLIVPRKGQTYKLTDEFIVAARDAILSEIDQEAFFRGRTLYIDRKPVHTFQFSRDYYWVLSDNMSDAIDSRHLGFIPEDHIIGTAWFCWFSKDKERWFKKIN